MTVNVVMFATGERSLAIRRGYSESNGGSPQSLQGSVRVLSVVVAILVLSVFVGLGHSPLDPMSYGLTTCGNTLLAAAAAIYLANVGFRDDAVGRWGSRLATVGVCAIGVSLCMRALEVYGMTDHDDPAPSYLYELIVAFTLVTVVAYLALESFYRSRVAGAFVLPAALIGVVSEIWLVANGVATPLQHPTQLGSYWSQAILFANGIGSAALGVAALSGGIYLLRLYAEDEGESCAKLQKLMSLALAIGFPVLLLVSGLGAMAINNGALGPDGDGAWRFAAAAAVAFFYLSHARRVGGARVAWFAIAGFGVTLAIAALSFPGGLS